MRKLQAWPNRLVLLAVLMSPALSCADPNAPIAEVTAAQVATNRDTYQWPDLLVLHLVNLSNVAILDDHCAGDAQAFGVVAGQWAVQYSRACKVSSVGLLRSIPAGGSVDDTFPGLGIEGRWRVQLQLQDSRGNVLPADSRMSNEFVVTARAGTGPPASQP